MDIVAASLVTRMRQAHIMGMVDIITQDIILVDMTDTAMLPIHMGTVTIMGITTNRCITIVGIAIIGRKQWQSKTK